MTMLVSLDETKNHLHIPLASTHADEDIALKIEIASDILLDFLKLAAVPEGWYTEDSPPVLETPALIKGVVLLMACELYTIRESSAANVLSDEIKNILRRYRDPALA